jgi:CHAD domain-containing protein
MIKSRDQGGAVCVTFTLPAAVGALHAAVCGEWNSWSHDHDVMARVEDGFSLTLRLEPGRTYRFRYLLDGYRWENDWAADRYERNAFGSDDSVVDLTALTIPKLEPKPAPVPAPLPAIEPDADEGADASTNVEREAKLVAPADLEMPSLEGLAPNVRAFRLPVVHLDATYFDTSDLRLARSGITLRYRSGEKGPAWTVKLPEEADQESDLVRTEIRFEGPPDHVPASATDLVLASTRKEALRPVARLSTTRRPVHILDEGNHLLVEVVDDTVSVSRQQLPTTQFREVEVELHATGSRGLRVLGAAVARLVDVGCVAGSPIPKLVRALGEAATLPPDVVVPPLAKDATVVDLVRHATARSVAQIIRHDPGARLGVDPENVHKLRVATRRLRSDLHSFKSLLDLARVDPVRAELRWLGGVVGAVRDIDVLTARLTENIDALPGIDELGVQRVMDALEEEGGAARAAMLVALRGARYLHLLDTLVELAAEPPFAETVKLTSKKSHKIARKIIGKPWRSVVDAVDALGDDPADARLHEVRILAKRSRYAAEATAPLLGPPAARFASAVSELQTVLGDHQDTVVAELWLQKSLAANPSGCETVHRLIALERSQRVALRGEWRAAWLKASSKAERSFSS